MKNFYISDTHFGHKNILQYDNRPFLTVEDMDKKLIENWNFVVSNEDHIYILGDFSWDTEPGWEKLLTQLKGQKTLIKGNHDISPCRTRKYFADVKDYKEIKDNNRSVVLCHYPIPCFNRHFYGGYHLYGHVHSSFEWNMTENARRTMEDLYLKPCNMYNVGAMMKYMNYTPRTLDEIIAGYEKERIKTNA